MINLVYVSSATRLMSKNELVELLEISRKNNAAMGITGILLYKDGNFMQLIEGEPEQIDKLYHKIGLDPRHTGMTKLYRREITERSFPDWQMGFKNLSDESMNHVDGFSSYMDEPLDGAFYAQNPDKAQRLLWLFRESMR